MTIESDNATKLSLKRKFEQRIPFATKGKPKSIALSGGIK